MFRNWYIIASLCVLLLAGCSWFGLGSDPTVPDPSVSPVMQTRAISYQPCVWAGIGLIALGIGSIAARAWFPVIPVSGSAALVMGGAGLIALPSVMTTLLWPASILATAVGLVWLIGLVANRWSLKPPVKSSEPTPTTKKES